MVDCIYWRCGHDLARFVSLGYRSTIIADLLLSLFFYFPQVHSEMDEVDKAYETKMSAICDSCTTPVVPCS